MKVAWYDYMHNMIVVKEKNPKAAIAILEDVFTNIHAGAELYRDGKKLARPVPGYPKIQSQTEGIEFGLRFNTSYYLVFPNRDGVQFYSGMSALAEQIEKTVQKRTCNAKVPVPYPRGHLYTTPDECSITVEGAHQWNDVLCQKRVGVFWDFNDCLTVADRDVILSVSMSLFRAIASKTYPLMIMPRDDDPSCLNYIGAHNGAGNITMRGSNKVITENPDVDTCTICRRTIVGLVFVKNNDDVRCIGCRSIIQADYRVYEMTPYELSAAKTMYLNDEQQTLMRAMNGAKKTKLSNGVTCYVGEKYIFAENTNDIIYGPAVAETVGREVVRITAFAAR